MKIYPALLLVGDNCLIAVATQVNSHQVFHPQRIDPVSPLSLLPSDDLSEISTPPEVAGPSLTPRMKQRNPATRSGILRNGFGPLGPVARGTGQCQIVQFRPASAGQRADMIDMKGRHGEVLTTQTVLATALRSLNNMLPER